MPFDVTKYVKKPGFDVTKYVKSAPPSEPGGVGWPERTTIGFAAGAENVRNAIGRLLGMKEQNIFAPLDQSLREGQSAAANVLPGVAGAVPYLIPGIGQAGFVSDLLTRPKEVVSGMAELSKTTKEAAYGEGLEGALSNIFKPFAKGKPEAQEVVSKQPVEAFLNALMIAGAAGAVKGAPKYLPKRGVKPAPVPVAEAMIRERVVPKTGTTVPKSETVPSQVDKPVSQIEKPAPVDMAAHRAKLLAKAAEYDKTHPREPAWIDVTPEGYGPPKETIDVVPEQLTTEQGRLLTSINEAKTILKGKISGAKRVAVEKSLKKAEAQYEASLTDVQRQERMARLPQFNDIELPAPRLTDKAKAKLERAGVVPKTEPAAPSGAAPAPLKETPQVLTTQPEIKGTLTEKPQSPPTELGALGTPGERGAGFNPFHYGRLAFQKAFGGRGEPGGRRLVNPLGTPEVTLAGRGIVEPFTEATHTIGKVKMEMGERLQPLLAGVKKGSPTDVALFDKLNDPNAVLGGNAAKIREHFDDLFKQINEHRTARGQEPVKYQKGYITHIIDFMKEQEAVFQDTRLPKSLRFAFEKRTGAPGYKRSAIEAIDTYTEAALRDIHIGDALTKAIPEVEKLTMGKNRPIVTTKTFTTDEGKTVIKHFYDLGGATWGSERAYAEAYIKGQLGWPTNLQRAAQTVLRLHPKTQMKASQAVTGAFYRSLIGAALDTATKNVTQILNTVSDFGAVPSLRGFAKLVTKRGWGETKGEHLLNEYAPLLHGGEDLKIGGKFGQIAKAIDETVLGGPMKFTEFMLRGTTYHTALDVYTKKGYSIETAHEMARASVRKLQFAYGKGNISPYVRGPLGRMMYQFFSYPTKQGELTYRWATEGNGGGAKLTRYFALTGALLVAGKYAGIDLSGIFIDPLKIIDPESKEGFKLPGGPRVKWSWQKMATSGFVPQGPAPVISAPLRIGKKLLSGDEYQRAQAGKEAIKTLIPGGRYGSKIYQSVKEFQGEPSTTARGRVYKQPSVKEAALRLVGLRGTEAEMTEEKRDRVNAIETDYHETRRKIIDLYVAKKYAEAGKLRTELVARYPYLKATLDKSLTAKAVKEEAKNKAMTAEERYFDNTLRQRIAQALKQ